MQEKIPLCVIIPTRNEEVNISDCIDSCSFAEEIIIIDDFSTDRTVEIAKSKPLNIQIVQRALNGDFGSQYTFGLEFASQPWVLFIDADERVSEDLKKSICQAIALQTPHRYWIQRTNFYKHHPMRHGVLRPDWVARLMPRDGALVKGLVHQEFLSPHSDAKLAGHLFHNPYRSWEHYFGKFTKYTDLSAEKYFSSGKRCSFVRDIVLRPLWAFFKINILNRGFLDGRYGWIFSVYHYFYTMTKYVKLYDLQENAEKSKEARKQQ